MIEYDEDIIPFLPTDIDLADCRTIIVGEAPGADEVIQKSPFVGRSGKLLIKTMEDIGLKKSSCFITNVFLKRPPDNKVMWFFDDYGSDVCTDFPPYKGKYLKSMWRKEIERLEAEISSIKPNIVMSVGATPLWALSGRDKITQSRGIQNITGGCLNSCKDIRMFATFHPAYVMRNRTMMEEFKNDISQVVELSKDHVSQNNLFEF